MENLLKHQLKTFFSSVIIFFILMTCMFDQVLVTRNYRLIFIVGAKRGVLLTCEPASHASHLSHNASHASHSASHASHASQAKN